MNYTKGPWIIRPVDKIDPLYLYRTVADDVGLGIAIVCNSVDDRTNAANARLIAAAPELLEALKSAVSRLNGHEDDSDNADLRDIIAKAGEEI